MPMETWNEVRGIIVYAENNRSYNDLTQYYEREELCPNGPNCSRRECQFNRSWRDTRKDATNSAVPIVAGLKQEAEVTGAQPQPKATPTTTTSSSTGVKNTSSAEVETTKISAAGVMMKPKQARKNLAKRVCSCRCYRIPHIHSECRNHRYLSLLTLQQLLDLHRLRKWLVLLSKRTNANRPQLQKLRRSTYLLSTRLRRPHSPERCKPPATRSYCLMYAHSVIPKWLSDKCCIRILSLCSLLHPSSRKLLPEMMPRRHQQLPVSRISSSRPR